MAEKWERSHWWEDHILKRTSPPYGLTNTFSNLIYIVIGIASMWTLKDPWFAAAMIWLGIGSGVYHCFLSRGTNAMDESGMFAVLGYLAVMNWTGVVFGAAIGMIRWKPGWLREVNQTHIIGVVFAVIMLQTGLASWLGVLTFATAYGIWNIGVHRVDNDNNPETVPWYGKYCHGTWHILTGLGFYLLLEAKM